MNVRSVQDFVCTVIDSRVNFLHNKETTVNAEGGSS